MDSKKFLELARTACEDGDDYEVRCYSGRAMYGKRCVAIEVERGGHPMHLAGLIMDRLSIDGADAETISDVIEVFAKTREDSMGRDSIMYWPDMEWPEDEPDPDAIEGYEDDRNG